MGFDKPDLGFVVHYQRPGSAIAYYQQVGRAGRAVDRAYGVLLSGREDDEIADYFLRTAFPPAERMRDILAALEAVDSATIGPLQRAVNLTGGQIDQALKLLELDGAVAKTGGRWSRTAEPWEPDEERIARVIATRRRELVEMRAYVTYTGCRMEYLTRPPRRPGGGAVRPLRERRRQGAAARGRHARSWTTRSSSCAAASGRSSRASAGRRTERASVIPAPNEDGVALCIYGDPGWGREVERGKHEAGRFSKALVAASVGAIRDRWRPSRRRSGSRRSRSRGHSSIVGDFAAAVAAELGLPYVAVPVDRRRWRSPSGRCRTASSSSRTRGPRCRSTARGSGRAPCC